MKLIQFLINFILTKLFPKNDDSTQNWFNKFEKDTDVEQISLSDVGIKRQTYKAKTKLKEKWAFPVFNVTITSKYGYRNLSGVGRQFHSGTDYTGKNKFALAPTAIIIKKIRKPDLKYPVRFKLSMKGDYYLDPEIPKGRAWTPYVIAEAVNDSTIRFQFKHVDPLVKPGDVLGINEKIGVIGNFGYSQGAHLHFGVLIKKNEKWVNVDPHKFIKTKIKETKND